MRLLGKVCLWVVCWTVLVPLSQPAKAERFTWFKYREYEGWAEDTGASLRLRLVPYLLGPDFSAAPPPGMFNFGSAPINAGEAPEFMPDGRVKLPYRIVRDSRLEPDALSSIALSSGLPIQRLREARQETVQARYRRVVLEIAGREAAVDTHDAQNLAGDTLGAFLVEEAALPDLRSGNYRIFVDYTHPVADYSALTLDMEVEQLSTAWVQAFREVVRRRSSSGGRFLFLDFSSVVSTSRVRESAQSGGLNQGSTRIDILLRDPTPEMQARVEAVLGFAKLTREDMLQRHRTGMTTALAAANPELAKAHALYVEAFSPDAPADPSKLAEALAALQAGDAIAFMSAGFQMRDSQQSGYYRYDYSLAASQTSQERTHYREYLIRNSDIESRYIAFAEPGGMARALEAARWKVHRDVFAPAQTPGMGAVSGPLPPVTLGSREWAAGVLRALRTGNPMWLRHALSEDVRQMVPLADIDAAIDTDGNRLLHVAARRGDQAAVDALLGAGAGVRRRNLAGDTAAVAAADAGHVALSERLRALAARDGRIVLEFVHGRGIKLGVDVVSPSGISGTPVRIDPTRLRWTSDDSARLIRLSAQLRIEALLSYGDCSRIRFQVYIQQIAGGCRIVATAPFQRLVRYRPESGGPYVMQVILRDWQTGFEVISAGE